MAVSSASSAVRASVSGRSMMSVYRHARPCAGHPRLTPTHPAVKDVDGRDIGERSDAVLRTAMPGHDDCYCHCEPSGLAFGKPKDRLREGIPRGKCRWIEIASARWRGPRNDGYVLLQAIAMQVRAVGVEPGLGALGVGADPEDRAPEARRMIHLDEMRDLVRRQTVEHEGRRQDESPGVGQHAGRRARAPAARLVADRHALDRDPEPGGVAPARRLEIALGFAFEMIGDPAPDMRRLP